MLLDHIFVNEPTCEHRVGRSVKVVALVGIAGSETAKKAERAVSLGNWTAGNDKVQVAPVRKSSTNCLMKPESGGGRTDSGVPITCNTKQQTPNKRYSKPLRLFGSVSKEAGSRRYHLPGVFDNLLAASAQRASISLPKSPSSFQTLPDTMLRRVKKCRQVHTLEGNAEP